MPKQLTTRGPVQIREYEPDRAAQGAVHRNLIDRVRVHEKGPDLLVEAFAQNIRLGTLVIPREAEIDLVARLFGEVPELRADRAAFQVLLQGFEDSAVAGALGGSPEGHRASWLRCMAAYDTMARDLATLSGLPQQGSTAA